MDPAASLDRARAAVDAPDPDASWSALEGLADAAGTADPGLLPVRESLHARITQDAEPAERLRPRARAYFDRLEAAARSLLDDPHRDAWAIYLGLTWIADELAWLADLVRTAVSGEAGADPLLRLRREAASCDRERRRRHDAEARGGAPAPAVDEGGEALAARLLDVEATRLLARTEPWLQGPAGPLSPEDARDRARAILRASDLAGEMERLRHAVLPPDLGHRLAERRDRLKEEFARSLGRTPPDGIADAIDGIASLILDRVNDAVAAAESVAPADALRQLAAASDEALWFRHGLEALREGAAPRGARRTLARARSKMGRGRRRCQAELQERRLQARLEGLIGYRAVRWLENLILILIFAAVLMLGIESATALAPEAVTAFAYADAAICAVFLAEFALKLALAERRGSYFLRHFLVDFLPSIPFGMLTLHAEGLHAIGEGLDNARFARLLRLLRLSRLTRYVRVARPVIRIFRVFTFALRGLDRVVQRNAVLLNRGVVFFEPAGDGAPGLADRIALLEESAHKKIERVLRDLAPDVAPRALAWRTAALSASLERVAASPLPPSGTAEDGTKGRDIRFEDLLARLEHAEARDVEEALGTGGSQQLGSIIGILDAPGIRSLPLLRDIIDAARLDGAEEGAGVAGDGAPERRDAAAAVSRAGRALARGLKRGLHLILWFADLHGTVTAPQLLDRLGAALVKTSAQPAKRLVMLGGLFVVIQLLLSFFPVEVIQGASRFLGKALGLPIIAIGLVCAGILIAGTWLRRMAGEATDLYERVSDAQFLPLLSTLKARTKPMDLSLLVQRVAMPEARVGTLAPPAGRPGGAAAAPTEREVSDLLAADPLIDGGRERGPAARGDPGVEAPRTDAVEGGPLPDDGSRAVLRRVALLYKDYLSGAMFHGSDNKTTGQLLGSIALENVRKARLGLPERECRRIEKLDLVRARALGGPYLWFNSIATALSHRIAKLILDYNAHCVPRDLQERRIEDPVVQRFLAWLEERQADARAQGRIARRLRDADRFKDIWAGRYATTEFTALHFLDPEMEGEVERRFGPAVRQALVRDRQNMIREVFGTYPFHRLPRSQRTVNPYTLYQGYVAGGRLFALPLVIVFLGVRGLILLAGRLRRAIRELRDPQHVPEVLPGSLAGIDVAIRKIQRMRKPVAIEAMRLRAQFDVEYLGLALPFGVSPLGAAWARASDDLDEIGATDAERAFFEERRREREECLVRLVPFIERHGFAGEDLLRKLDAASQPATAAGAAIRAMAIAYAIDHEGVRTLAEAPDILRRTVEAVKDGSLPRGVGLIRRLRGRLGGQGDPAAAAIERLAGAGAIEATPVERKGLAAAMRADPDGVGRTLAILGDPRHVGRYAEAACERFDEIVRRPGIFTDELVSLRAVATLAILDLRNYQSLVRYLGGYGAPAPAEVGGAEEASAPRAELVG